MCEGQERQASSRADSALTTRLAPGDLVGEGAVLHHATSHVELLRKCTVRVASASATLALARAASLHDLSASVAEPVFLRAMRLHLIRLGMRVEGNTASIGPVLHASRCPIEYQRLASCFS